MDIIILPIISILFAVLLLVFIFLKNKKYFISDILIILLNLVVLGGIFLSNNITEYIANTLFFLGILCISYILKKCLDQEVVEKEEILKLTKDLDRANVELRRLDRAKSEFISIASHQLRTPLTAIKGYISLMLEGAYGSNSSKIEDALNKVFLANERIIQLVEDLLNITRIESGKLEYHYADGVQVEEVLEELKDLFVIRIKEKNLDFQIEYPKEKLPLIKADRSKLREVISNLIDNAIKYTNEGYVHVSVKYKRKFVRITIEDSGVGVSPESLRTLFKKFSRGTDDTKMYTEGTGLGLYVGKSFIESQGGRIYAKSDGIGKGSQFIVEMPV